MSHTKIRDPNSKEAKLINAWQKCCAPDKKDAPIPQHYINGFIDGYAALEHRNAELVKCLTYWRDQCSGAEPSISVFERMVYKALAAQKVIV